MLGYLDLAAKVLFVVVFFGLCIFVHEFGHLLMALWRGLHVERFSVGFGKKIWSFTYRNVEYVISVLPFGGYVALPQLDPTDKPTTSDGKPLPRTSPVNRALTAAAGPIANLAFGFVLGFLTWWVGVYQPEPAKFCTVWKVPRYLPLYKNGLEKDDTILSMAGKAAPAQLPEALAALPTGTKSVDVQVERKGKKLHFEYHPIPNPEYVAGLRPMDRILAANGDTFTKGWPELSMLITLNTDNLVLRIKPPHGKPRNIVYRPYPNPLVEGLGFPFFQVIQPTEAARILPDSPAAKAGLMKGDMILRVNGKVVPDTETFIDMVAGSHGKPLNITVQRGGKEVTIRGIRAKPEDVKGQTIYRIGMALDAPKVIAHPNPWEQFEDVSLRTARTLASLFAPVAGRTSLVRPRHMSGPVGIIEMIWYRLQTEGYRGGLAIIILVTFNLAFFNLLPIPVLDGGHILYSAIELVIRRRLPSRIIYGLQNAFAVLIIGFMIYITSHDVQRWVKIWHIIHPKHQELVVPKGRPATAKPAVGTNGTRAAKNGKDAKEESGASTGRPEASQTPATTPAQPPAAH